MITTIISIAVWILSVVGYVIFNLYNKNKKLENIASNYMIYIKEMNVLMKDFDELVNKIDSQIWVQSDPELLGLFEKIKEMQKKSKQFLD
jgi:uncharacterized protein YoxC